MSLQNCKLINLPKISDPRGSITFIENQAHIPFDIRRIYYLYDVPVGQARAAHAHKDLCQVFIAINGSFSVKLDDGDEVKEFHLDNPFTGLYVCSKIWRDIYNFNKNAVCLVLASDYYSEHDYLRNYPDFLNYIKS
jgi:WxcM-like, C-terminal